MLDERVTKFIADCKQEGLHVTYQRIAIFQNLLTRNDHPTAEDIYKSICEDYPTISLATIYKTLETLVEKKLINKVNHLHQFARYDGNVRLHHHLVCTRCKKIVDVNSEILNQLTLPPDLHQEFQITNFRVQFDGICPDCQTRTENN